MNDFRSADPEDMYYKELRDTVDRYKNNPVEVENMGKELENWIAEERAEGRVEGRTEGDKNRALADIRNLMKSLKLTAEKAMDILEIPAKDRDAIKAAL